MKFQIEIANVTYSMDAQYAEEFITHLNDALSQANATRMSYGKEQLRKPIRLVLNAETERD